MKRSPKEYTNPLRQRVPNESKGLKLIDFGSVTFEVGTDVLLPCLFFMDLFWSFGETATILTVEI